MLTDPDRRRRPEPRKICFTFRVSEREAKWLKEKAGLKRKTIADMVRDIIDDGIKRAESES